MCGAAAKHLSTRSKCHFKCLLGIYSVLHPSLHGSIHPFVCRVAGANPIHIRTPPPPPRRFGVFSLHILYITIHFLVF